MFAQKAFKTKGKPMVLRNKLAKPKENQWLCEESQRTAKGKPKESQRKAKGKPKESESERKKERQRKARAKAKES